MFLETVEGLQTLGAGTPGRLRASKNGALVTAAGLGRYTEAVRKGNVFSASMQAGAALGTALTSTAVTLTLYNPSSSNKILSLLGVSVGQTTGLTGASTTVYVLAGNVDPAAVVPATNTAATVRNCLLGAGSGSGIAYTATTLPATPVVLFPVQAYRVIGATPVSEYGLATYNDLGGIPSLMPNTAVTLQGIGAASSGIVSFIWEEID